MNLSLDATVLRRALGAVKPLTTAKAPKNGVAHGLVLAVYPSGEVAILATNGDTFARLVVGQTAARTITPTGWALDVTGVKTLLSLLPKRGPVALTVGDGGGLAVNGSAVGVSEDNGAWPMFMVGGAPPLALRAMATLDVALDIDLASAVADVCSTDETRYCLNGIFFDADGSIVATDGHRMMVLAPGMGRRAHEAAVILPQVAWRVAAKALSTMNISTDADATWRVDAPPAWIVLHDGVSAVWSRAIEGRYPDWRQVLPAPNSLPSRVDVDVAELASTLKRHAAVSGGHTATRCHVNGGLALATTVGETALNDVLPGARTGPDGPPTGLNATYLRDAAVTFAGFNAKCHVRLAMVDELSPFTLAPAPHPRGVEGGEYALTALIMPMRI